MSDQSQKLLLSLYIIFSTCYGSPIVTISQGTLEGVNLTSYDGRTISGFMGIPYAQPPLGDLRFKAPQAASSWTDTYSATNGTIRCTQVINDEVVGGEDCLYLNVYTPQLPEDNTTLLPVMVYVYGGGFASGAARPDSYGPHYLMDYDVVLVLMNYRLGSLGFLTTGDEEAPGNFGLKDQILALRWLQDNVAAFGGDPDRVTIFGNSAGAMSIHNLALSDQTEGLFHQFILQSGLATDPGAYRDKSKSALITTALAESFNCSTDNSSIIIQCLREQDAEELISWLPADNEIAFLPTNEPESDEAVITDSPKNLIEQGKMRDLPWITGVTKDEGLLFTSSYYSDEDQWDNVLANLKEYVDAAIKLLDVDDVTEYTNAVMEYYFNDLTIDKNVILQNFTKFVGDFYFVYPVVDLLETQKTIRTQPAYVYIFGYMGTNTISISNYDEISDNVILLGTCHGDDISYIFTRTSTRSNNTSMSETDLKMMRRMTGLWTSFATNGVPTLTGVDDAEEWLEYGENDNYLRIGNETSLSLVMESTPFPARMSFWRELIGSMNSAGSRHCSFHVVTLVVTFFTSFIMFIR